jgi:hypothetical protein
MRSWIAMCTYAAREPALGQRRGNSWLWRPPLRALAVGAKRSEDAASERRRRLAWAQQQLDRKAVPAIGLLGIEDSGQDLSGVETLRASLRPR